MDFLNPQDLELSKKLLLVLFEMDCLLSEIKPTLPKSEGLYYSSYGEGVVPQALLDGLSGKRRILTDGSELTIGNQIYQGDKATLYLEEHSIHGPVVVKPSVVFRVLTELLEHFEQDICDDMDIDPTPFYQEELEDKCYDSFFESLEPSIKEEIRTQLVDLLSSYQHYTEWSYIDDKEWALGKFGNLPGIVKYYGSYTDANEPIKYLILKRYQGTIAEYPNSLSLALKSAIVALEQIHATENVHRDICPMNLLVSDNEAVLTDLGTVFNIRLARSLGFAGKPLFAGLGSHEGHYLYSDDILSLVYIYELFTLLSLPWIGPGLNLDKDDLDQIYELKKNWSPKIAVAKAMMEHLNLLKYEEKPYYKYLISLI